MVSMVYQTRHVKHVRNMRMCKRVSTCVKTAIKLTIMLNIHFVLLTIRQMTHTSDSTTHYYSHYSHRSIIFLHSKLQDTVTFFRLAYAGCYFFSLLLFFVAKTVTFIRYFFSCYFLSEHHCGHTGSTELEYF